MGLTVYYKLKSAVESPRAARALVEKLHRRAKKLPFQQVNPIESYPGAAADNRGEDSLWLCTSGSIERGRRTFEFRPRHGFAFFIVPGPGSEWASIGLLRYPQTIKLPNGRRTRTGESGWSWYSSCKTQYASNPRYGGFENFRRCHVSLIELLDTATELGLNVTVKDEGHYTTHRDLNALRREIDEWNQLIAGGAGLLKDSWGSDLEAPILSFPNFEHLEADGHARQKKSKRL